MKETSFDILFSFLRDLILWRLKNPEALFKDGAPLLANLELPDAPVTTFIKANNFNQEEIITFLIALSPYLKPSFLMDCIAEVFPSGIDLPQFGGVKGKQHRGILPTGETVQFIIAGNNMQERIACITMFSTSESLEKSKTLYLEKPLSGEPLMSGMVTIYPETFFMVTTGVVPAPKMSPEFPAEKLETKLSKKDLILSPSTTADIEELETWLKHSSTFLEEWEMKNRVKAGYRVLFYGPPGTGKTLTASLLGKYTGKDVYRIDLSTVVSKYIGETEKNLSNLFDKAAHKDWILFFDEADAIFGKRTSVQSSNDKYANQEVSYLLQRVESHSGLVILATNFKDNIDHAFIRRFQSVCQFKMPSSIERLRLWSSNLPKKLVIDSSIDINEVAEKYELSGSNIINIIQYCSLKVLSLESDILTSRILKEGIRKEYSKENRLF